ncbi:MAG: hypothetical protein IPJ57_09985 [Gemmatimonadetes bacterium]|nr:hypothetical protein [Gemmatimonadota bacterium]MBK9066482.1 hypothetical protein [Gemmatimonadota bacterium]
MMFRDNPDSKPVSIIITTLAGRAYQGEADLESALRRILSTMGNLVNQGAPRVPNPVYPGEDFADKWSDPARKHLDLERHFWQWLEQAKADFNILTSPKGPDLLLESAKRSVGVLLSREALTKILGQATTQALLREPVAPPGLSFPPKPITPTKPAGFAAS